MPLFLIFFIVFIIWFRVKIRKNDSEIASRNDAFWAREEQANFARAHDISTLNYLSVSEDALPFLTSKTFSDEKEADLEERVRETSRRKMLNLSAYSNTDLKEQYQIVTRTSYSLYVLWQTGEHIFMKRKTFPVPGKSWNIPVP